MTEWQKGYLYSLVDLIRNVHVTYCARKMPTITYGNVGFKRRTGTPAFLNVFVQESYASTEFMEHTHMWCLVEVRLRRIHGGAYWFPIAVPACLRRVWKATAPVGLMLLHAPQLSGYVWIEALIYLLECHVKVVTPFQISSTVFDCNP